jgi:hypothetical protein
MNRFYELTASTSFGREGQRFLSGPELGVL